MSNSNSGFYDKLIKFRIELSFKKSEFTYENEVMQHRAKLNDGLETGRNYPSHFNRKEVVLAGYVFDKSIGSQYDYYIVKLTEPIERGNELIHMVKVKTSDVLDVQYNQNYMDFIQGTDRNIVLVEPEPEPKTPEPSKPEIVGDQSFGIISLIKEQE